MIDRMHINLLWNVFKHFKKYQIAVILLWSIINTENALCGSENLDSPSKLMDNDLDLKFEDFDLNDSRKGDDQIFEKKDPSLFSESTLHNSLTFEKVSVYNDFLDDLKNFYDTIVENQADFESFLPQVKNVLKQNNITIPVPENEIDDHLKTFFKDFFNELSNIPHEHQSSDSVRAECGSDRAKSSLNSSNENSQSSEIIEESHELPDNSSFRDFISLFFQNKEILEETFHVLEKNQDLEMQNEVQKLSNPFIFTKKTLIFLDQANKIASKRNINLNEVLNPFIPSALDSDKAFHTTIHGVKIPLGSVEFWRKVNQMYTVLYKSPGGKSNLVVGVLGHKAVPMVWGFGFDLFTAFAQVYLKNKKTTK